MQGPQGGPLSSHFTLRFLHVLHPLRDFLCGRLAVEEVILLSELFFEILQEDSREHTCISRPTASFAMAEDGILYRLAS